MKVEHVNTIRKRLADGALRTYYYNRKTGNRIYGAPGSLEFSNSYLESWNTTAVFDDTLTGLISEYRNSPGFNTLAEPTRKAYLSHLKSIEEMFGSIELEGLADGRIRGHFSRWHENMARTAPRVADYKLSVLKTVLQFGYDKGRIPINHAAGLKNIYKSDRSKIIWEPGEIELFCSGSTAALAFAIRFASLTGLRRTDLVSIDLNADKGNYLLWATSKSRRRTEVIIPVIAELRHLLNEMQAHRARNGVTATTILFNVKGRPWTPDGLSSSFDRRRAKTGITKRLHDFRGTFVLKLVNANFEDAEIAEIVGWSTQDLKAIRRKYVDRGAVVQAAIRRIERSRG